MERLLIFGGTTEGRELSQAALSRGDDMLVLVTSEYARSLLPEGVPCRVGAMDEAQMAQLIREFVPDRVLDATHPYAVRATAAIRAACGSTGTRYVRIERPAQQGEGWRDAVQWVKSADEAAQAVLQTDGNVLLTTGSNTLPVFAKAVDPQRLFVRVLPTHRALDICKEAGLPQSHVIAMQGPFSAELNAALYDQLGIRVMVSKDSGAAGGVAEKVLPALLREIHVIMIERPKEEDACAENR